MIFNECEKRFQAIQSHIVPLTFASLGNDETLLTAQKEALTLEFHSSDPPYKKFHDVALRVEELLAKQQYTLAAMYFDTLERLFLSLQLGEEQLSVAKPLNMTKKR